MTFRAVSASALLLSLFVLAGCGGTRGTVSTRAANDPNVVASFGGETLDLSTFEDRYARTVGGTSAAQNDSLPAYQDFLQRYVDFRLKVLAAREAGLHNSAQIQEEIETYRRNLARPYLLEQEVIDPVVRLLYERQGQVVDASHILVLVNEFASPEDTLRAYARMQSIVDSLEAGMEFGEAAFNFSEDPSAKTRGPGERGQLGYFTGGDMVDEFEDAAYTTPVGQRSGIFRTRYGYHILYVHDRRPTPEDIRVAHIMIQPDGSENATQAAIDRANDLRSRVLAGEDFAALAAEHSVDQGSAANGGDLGFIPFNAPLVEPFKSTAFALQNPGDISEVIETQYGFHVIKLLERKPRPTLEEAYSDLKTQAARLPRAKTAQDALAREVLISNGARIDTAFVAQTIGSLRPDSALARMGTNGFSPEVMNHPVAVLGDSVYTFGEMAAFAATQRIPTHTNPTRQALAFLDPFLYERAVDFEAAALERRDPEFGRIMEDFRDGLVLFKLMEDSVWNAASQDSVGLRAFYEGRAATYTYPERTRIVGLQSASDSLLTAYAARLDAGTPLSALVTEIAADEAGTVRIDTMLVSGPTNSVYDRALPLQQGQHTGALPYRGQRILLVHDGSEAPRQKTFEEARAEVVSQYQQVLEERLIERLRSRYDARTFPERLGRAFQRPTTTAASGTATSE